jgi:hypothetical protein
LLKPLSLLLCRLALPMPLPIAPGGLFTFPSRGRGGIGGGCIKRLSAIPRETGSVDEAGTFGVGTGAGSVGGGPTLLAEIVVPRRVYGQMKVNTNCM